MNLMPPDAPPPSGAPAVGPPLPAGEEGAGRLRAPRRLARPRRQGDLDVFFMRGAGRLGMGTGVEVVGDVANQTDKPAIGATRIGCAD